ncbi:hypothetical protein GCM10027614_11580 [Micromonospora vulcania]
MASEAVTARADRRLHRARQGTLLSLVTGVWASVLLPAVGLTHEPDPRRVALGAVGILAFVATQTAVLYAAVTPWLDQRWRRRAQLSLAGAAVLTIPLVGPLAAGTWPTWAWLGASLIGMAPLLVRLPAALAVAAGTLLVSAGWPGGPAARSGATWP